MAFLTGGANSAADTGFDVANSYRSNSGDSPKLSKTFSSASNSNTTFTVSAWVKRSKLGANQDVVSAFRSSDGLQTDLIRFGSGDDLEFWAHTTNSSGNADIQTNRLFRDVGAWYHIVVRVDTTQGTDTNRVRIYVNGVQETSFSTSNYMSQNGTIIWGLGSGVEHTIGAVGTSNYFGGYVAEVVYLDSQSVAPTTFGEFDEDSPTIWKPIDVSGLTFGNNSFYLDFQNSGELGTDVSGNSHTFTENNIAATDQSTDTCTNNFATINSLDKNLTTFSEGNLKLNWSVAALTFGLTTGTIGMTAGKWYWEAKITSADNSTGVGLGVIQTEPYLSRETATGVDPSLFYGLGARFTTVKSVTKTSNNVDTSISDTWSNDDIIRIAYDGDSGNIYMWMGTDELNGQTFSTPTSFNDATLTAETLVLPFVSLGDGGSGTKTSQVEFNFGGTQSFSISSGNTDGNGYGNFEYSVPSGYYALCTKNLAEFG